MSSEGRRLTNSGHGSPCQFVPATPSFLRHVCTSPAALVPSSPWTNRHYDSPSIAVSPLARREGRVAESESMTVQALEFGETIMFINGSPALPWSEGTHRDNVEQIVPATPIRTTAITTSQHTSLMTSSPSSNTRDVIPAPCHDVTRDSDQSRAEKQKQRAQNVLQSSSSYDALTLVDFIECDEGYGLFAGSEEDIFL